MAWKEKKILGMFKGKKNHLLILNFKANKNLQISTLNMCYKCSKTEFHNDNTRLYENIRKSPTIPVRNKKYER